MASRKLKMPEENFFDALEMLSRERGIPTGELINRIGKAIETAVKKDYDVDEEHIRMDVDMEARKFGVVILKQVVAAYPEADPEGLEPEPDLRHLILLEDAVKIKKSAKVGQTLEIPIKTKEFGRISAQTAKHVIRQGLRDAERSQVFTEMQSKSHEILPAVVANVNERSGLVTLTIGKTEAVLPKGEQVPGEVLLEGQRIKVFIMDVQSTERGPKILISRTHPNLVKRIFEMEVPEIYDGTVEIKAISREAGQRTKMAVWSKNPDVDAVGACIGPKGSRVAAIVEELNGEKIDIVPYSDDPATFISAALSPANVVKVELLDGEKKSCRVTVPDHQLSLAIGNKGQNARLTARLTGYNIDIRPESGYYGEEPDDKAAAQPEA